MGVIAGAAVAIALPNMPKFLLVPLALLAGTIGGALWSFVPGYLRAVLGVNEILSTVMMNYIAVQFYGFASRPDDRPCRAAGRFRHASVGSAPRSAWIDRIIPGTRLHWGIAIALVLALVVQILLWRTTWGFRMRAAGASPKSARYAGINVERCLLMAMVLAGAFAGLAGAVEVTGVHRRVIEGIPSNYGFSGVVVALFEVCIRLE